MTIDADIVSGDMGEPLVSALLGKKLLGYWDQFEAATGKVPADVLDIILKKYPDYTPGALDDCIIIKTEF